MNKSYLNLLLFLLLLIGCVPGNSVSISVCEDCSIQDVGEAVQRSQPFDTILINSGKYHVHNVEITHPLTILGRGHPVLDGSNEGYIFQIFSDNVHIAGLTFVNSGRSYIKDYAAIYSYKVKNFSITNNTVINPFFGFLIEKSSRGVLSGNLIYGKTIRQDETGNGIHLWHCDSILIKDNEIYGMRDGIYLEFVKNSVIEKNLSHDNVRYGLHFMFSNHDQYLQNTFKSNGAGVAVMFSKFILMKKNTFIHNWGAASYGLLLKEIYDAEVEENSFIENSTGIYVEGSTRINYVHNNLERNGWAVKVTGGCYANAFVNNNFTGNSFDVSYNGKLNDNQFHGNYWSSYSGYDLDNDGMGDVPHRPLNLFSYIVNQTPETVVLLRSLFVDIINFSEKVSPVFTPDNLIDKSPSMKRF